MLSFLKQHARMCCPLNHINCKSRTKFVKADQAGNSSSVSEVTVPSKLVKGQSNPHRKEQRLRRQVLVRSMVKQPILVLCLEYSYGFG